MHRRVKRRKDERNKKLCQIWQQLEHITGFSDFIQLKLESLDKPTSESVLWDTLPEALTQDTSDRAKRKRDQV